MSWSPISFATIYLCAFESGRHPGTTARECRFFPIPVQSRPNSDLPGLAGRARVLSEVASASNSGFRHWMRDRLTAYPKNLREVDREVL